MAGFIYQKVSGEASWLSVRGYQILKFAGTSTLISFEFPFSNLVDILLMTYLFRLLSHSVQIPYAMLFFLFVSKVYLFLLSQKTQLHIWEQLTDGFALL